MDLTSFKWLKLWDLICKCPGGDESLIYDCFCFRAADNLRPNIGCVFLWDLKFFAILDSGILNNSSFYCEDG